MDLRFASAQTELNTLMLSINGPLLPVCMYFSVLRRLHSNLVVCTYRPRVVISEPGSVSMFRVLWDAQRYGSSYITDAEHRHRSSRNFTTLGEKFYICLITT